MEMAAVLHAGSVALHGLALALGLRSVRRGHGLGLARLAGSG